MNECLEETDDCLDIAECLDHDGSYECVCKPGYVKDMSDTCIREYLFLISWRVIAFKML